MILYALLLHIPLNCWWLLLLAALIPFILGILLGWLLRSGLLAKIRELEAENKKNHDRAVDMEKNFMSLKYEHDELHKEHDRIRGLLRSAEADNMMLRGKLEQAMAMVAPPAGRTLSLVPPGQGMNFGLLFPPDNLQIIEGIGPKVEELLKSAGISSWASLAAKPIDELTVLLQGAGLSMMDPISWPQQAKLATEGKWDELIEYQKFLDAGREKAGDFENPSKIEKAAFALLGFQNDPEDLKIVEGIGPKIEELLKNAGIKTWVELAAAHLDQLKKVLDDAGDRYRLADPGTWAEQAALAAEGRWYELKELQDRLKGGKA